MLFDETLQGRDLRYMYLDACYDEEDEDEMEAFDKSMEQLFELLKTYEGLETPTINQQACEFAIHEIYPISNHTL